MREYYTLQIKRGDNWETEFGSYDRIEALVERLDMIDRGEKAKNIRIVKTIC